MDSHPRRTAVTAVPAAVAEVPQPRSPPAVGRVAEGGLTVR